MRDHLDSITAYVTAEQRRRNGLVEHEILMAAEHGVQITGLRYVQTRWGLDERCELMVGDDAFTTVRF